MIRYHIGPCCRSSQVSGLSVSGFLFSAFVFEGCEGVQRCKSLGRLQSLPWKGDEEFKLSPIPQCISMTTTGFSDQTHDRDYCDWDGRPLARVAPVGLCCTQVGVGPSALRCIADCILRSWFLVFLPVKPLPLISEPPCLPGTRARNQRIRTQTRRFSDLHRKSHADSASG